MIVNTCVGVSSQRRTGIMYVVCYYRHALMAHHMSQFLAAGAHLMTGWIYHMVLRVRHAQ